MPRPKKNYGDLTVVETLSDAEIKNMSNAQLQTALKLILAQAQNTSPEAEPPVVTPTTNKIEEKLDRILDEIEAIKANKEENQITIAKLKEENVSIDLMVPKCLIKKHNRRNFDNIN